MNIKKKRNSLNVRRYRTGDKGRLSSFQLENNFQFKLVKKDRTCHKFLRFSALKLLKKLKCTLRASHAIQLHSARPSPCHTEVNLRTTRASRFRAAGDFGERPQVLFDRVSLSEAKSFFYNFLYAVHTTDRLKCYFPNSSLLQYGCILSDPHRFLVTLSICPILETSKSSEKFKTTPCASVV